MGTAAFFAAFAFDVDDGGPVIGGADIVDVDRQEFFSAQPGKQSGENQRQIPFSPIGSALGVPVVGDGCQECCDCCAGEGLGEGLGKFRPVDQLHGVGS